MICINSSKHFGTIDYLITDCIQRRNIIMLPIFFSVMFWMIFFLASPAYTGLLGDVYTDAVSAVCDSDHDEIRQHVFYSKDGIESVYAFYKGAYGQPDHESSNQFRWTLKIYFAEYAGLTIETPRAAVREDFQVTHSASAAIASPECYTHEIFLPLNQIAMTQPDKSKDFINVCNRFLHLTWSYFMVAPETDHHGKPLSMKEHILSRQTQIRPKTTQSSMEEDYARMVAMALAGQTEEVEEIGRQMIEGTRPAMGWDEYVNLLKEIDEHAYRTRILIQTDPANWPEWRR